MVERNRRQINGIVLLDKPIGLTSNEALQTVKRLYQAKKAGHTGSLDPLASGLLPICLGAATKLSGYLLDADKTYRFTARLGITTSTGDAEGTVVKTMPVEVPEQTKINALLPRFMGKILQRPPMYSAVKHNGQRLYRLARQGKEVERPLREVTVYDLQLVNREEDRLEFQVRCSKGTYVRTLAEDIGEALGCGAHVTELRRLGVGTFDARQMVPLDKLRECARTDLRCLDAYLLPLDSAIRLWPEVRLVDDAVRYLRNGQSIFTSPVPDPGYVRLYGKSGHFLGVGEVLSNGRVAPRRLMER